ncbi:MAG: uncharacterized protein QOI38_2079 [Sphingomonadales bacterium]|nr:uncharacterized protein [Sphingomonadales bacterium]
MARTMMAAALLTLATPLAAQTTEVRPISGTRLDVVAMGQVTREPDIVLINAGVSTQAPTATEAIRANAAKMETLRAALRRAGIADRDVQSSAVQLNAQYRHSRETVPEFLGYRAGHILMVRFRDAANAGRILDALVTAGANEINGPTFQVSTADAALDEARTRALAAARARADLYARSLGMRVARILAISEAGQVFQGGIAAGYGESRAAADTNIVLGEQALGVSLTVSFELE